MTAGTSKTLQKESSKKPHTRFDNHATVLEVAVKLHASNKRKIIKKTEEDKDQNLSRVDFISCFEALNITDENPLLTVRQVKNLLELMNDYVNSKISPFNNNNDGDANNDRDKQSLINLIQKPQTQEQHDLSHFYNYFLNEDNITDDTFKNLYSEVINYFVCVIECPDKNKQKNALTTFPSKDIADYACIPGSRKRLNEALQKLSSSPSNLLTQHFDVTNEQTADDIKKDPRLIEGNQIHILPAVHLLSGVSEEDVRDEFMKVNLPFISSTQISKHLHRLHQSNKVIKENISKIVEKAISIKDEYLIIDRGIRLGSQAQSNLDGLLQEIGFDEHHFSLENGMMNEDYVPIPLSGSKEDNEKKTKEIAEKLSEAILEKTTEWLSCQNLNIPSLTEAFSENIKKADDICPNFSHEKYLMTEKGRKEAVDILLSKEDKDLDAKKFLIHHIHAQTNQKRIDFDYRHIREDQLMDYFSAIAIFYEVGKKCDDSAEGGFIEKGLNYVKEQFPDQEFSNESGIINSFKLSDNYFTDTITPDGYKILYKSFEQYLDAKDDDNQLIQMFGKPITMVGFPTCDKHRLIDIIESGKIAFKSDDYDFYHSDQHIATEKDIKIKNRKRNIFDFEEISLAKRLLGQDQDFIVNKIFHCLMDKKEVDYDNIRKLLSINDIDINDKKHFLNLATPDGKSLFSMGIEDGNVAVCSLLLELDTRDIDDKEHILNQRNNEGLLPAMYASYKDRTEIMKLLLDHEPRDIDDKNHILNQKDDEGVNALMYACYKGRHEILALLLKKETRKISDINHVLNQRDNEGLSPAMHASYNGHSESLSLLLAYENRDIHDENHILNQKDNKGQNALIHAFYNGHTEIVKLLLDHETRDIHDKNHILNQKNILDQGGLICASYSGHIEIVKSLLDHETRDIDDENHILNQKDNQGRNAYDWASHVKNYDIANFLSGASKRRRNH